MKTTVRLGYDAVLVNAARPVNLVLQFDPPAVIRPLCVERTVPCKI